LSPYPLSSLPMPFPLERVECSVPVRFLVGRFAIFCV
jgi:hypothetical protein